MKSPTQKTTPSFEDFVSKVERMRKEGGVDLSTAEDLSLAIMNLVSLEEHFFFTGVKTQQEGYFDTSNEIRTIRKELLAKLLPSHEGETWCISKHLLAATMRLIEVGTKLQSNNKKTEAKDMFEKAYRIYSMFWALKLKLISGQKLNETAVGSSRLEDLISKLADCCDE